MIRRDVITFNILGVEIVGGSYARLIENNLRYVSSLWSCVLSMDGPCQALDDTVKQNG